MPRLRPVQSPSPAERQPDATTRNHHQPSQADQPLGSSQPHPARARHIAVQPCRASQDKHPHGQAAQDIITKYSGEWTADRFIEIYGSAGAAIVAELQADPKRAVVLPSPEDMEQVHTAFQAVISDWLKADPRNQGLLDLAQTELTSLRAAE